MFRNQTTADFEKSISKNNLFIFGASNAGKKAINYCENHNYKVLSVVDNNPDKWGKRFNGYAVISPEKLLEYGSNNIVVLIASVYLKEIAQQLNDMGIKNIFSAHLCQMLETRKLSPISNQDMQQVEKLKLIVADEKSRETIDRIAELRNKGVNNLYEVFAGRQYFQKDIFEFSNEVFLDCGSYIGEEIDYLNGLNCGRHKIYAFEPDYKNFAVINKKYCSCPNIICINKGVWNQSCELYFNADGTDGSMVSEYGTDRIEAAAIDEIINEKVTFIKMDIEGSELQAIQGAKKTIVRDKPKLAICIYHLDSDLWEIPFAIHSLAEDYDIFIRQHSLGLSDTVMYAKTKAEG